MLFIPGVSILGMISDFYANGAVDRSRDKNVKETAVCMFIKIFTPSSSGRARFIKYLIDRFPTGVIEFAFSKGENCNNF